MQKVSKILILLSLIIFLFASCSSAEKQLLQKIDNDRILPDSCIIKGISPWYHTGLPDEFKYRSARVNKRYNLHLDSLELGYNTFQIRVWLGHSLAIIKHILIIKRIDNKWNGQLIALSFEEDGIEKNIETKSISPKSGWNNLLIKLNELNIFNLEDPGSLIGYDGAQGGADGISYDFEIATPTKYRIYRYGILEGYQDKYHQVKNVQQITELFEKEFRFEIIR